MIKIYLIHEIKYHLILQSIEIDYFYPFIVYNKHFLYIKSKLVDYDYFHNIYKQAVLKETPLIINNLQLTINGVSIILNE